MCRYFLLAALFLLTVPLRASQYHWMISDTAGNRALAENKDAGTFSCEAALPGNFMVHQTAERNTFRHDKAVFDAATLTFSVHADGIANPLRTWIYAKDKEGAWYQSRAEYAIAPGDNTLTLQIDNPGAMLPIGHSGTWNPQVAAAMFEFGFTVFANKADAGKVQITVKNPVFAGKRYQPALKITNWQLPRKVDFEDIFESRFQLTKEYFNPFNPDEIQVDYEYAYLPDGDTASIVPPEGAERGIYPAFYAQDFARIRQYTKESVMPAGSPYWAFRMTPHRAGTMLIRVVATDRSDPQKPETVRSEWRRVGIRPSNNKGPIRVSPRDPQYFEFANGDFFYPVGLNIHANTDFRSEMNFEWHHVADQKSFDYDEYFDACGKGGINMIEIWMATWTCAIEWNSSMQYFYGVGRYNQANSWRLDHMFRNAASKGIYLNLVFDSHGRLSTSTDQEWNMNPYNLQRASVTADGGFLNQPADYYTDARAIQYDRKRTRYLMARWGAFPNLFANEFMSEVNLVQGTWDMLQNDKLTTWCRNAVAYLHTVDQGGHLVTIHCSGDSGTTVTWRKLFEMPEFTHVVGDAYRGTGRPFLEQLRIHRRDLSIFSSKPVLATEYGEPATALADVHSGIWGSIFFNQAGTPCLWWHDFVHIKNEYHHFKAFSAFMKDVDLRGATNLRESVPYAAIPAAMCSCADQSRRIYATTPARQIIYSVDGYMPAGLKPHANAHQVNCYAMLTPANGGAVLWLHKTAALVQPPEDAATTPPLDNIMLETPRGLVPGTYRAVFRNTWKDEVLGEVEFRIGSDRAPVMLVAPPFHLDIACKILPVTPGNVYAALPWIGGE